MVKTAALLSALLVASTAFAQQDAAPLQVPHPHYVTVPLTIEVNAPADKVWARVGKFCDVGEWNPAPDGSGCKYLAGDGDVGTVRSLVNEVLVGKTKYSYTYAQAPRENTPYNMYHGTVEVVPLTATTSRLSYVLIFDSSMMTDAARDAYLKDRETRFNLRLRNMKLLAEGGKSPTPGAPTVPATAPFLSLNPHYVVIPMQMEVNAPVETVWSHIGHFCDVSKLGSIGFPACTIVSGTDGEYGVVRNIGNEVLVGKTKYSYTYTQQMRATGFYPLYHATIEARPVTPKTSTLYWTLVYDNSNLPDDAAREKDVATRRARFMGMMKDVKILSEGGNMPPTAAP